MSLPSSPDPPVLPFAREFPMFELTASSRSTRPLCCAIVLPGPWDVLASRLLAPAHARRSPRQRPAPFARRARCEAEPRAAPLKAGAPAAHLQQPPRPPSGAPRRDVPAEPTHSSSRRRRWPADELCRPCLASAVSRRKMLTWPRG